MFKRIVLRTAFYVFCVFLVACVLLGTGVSVARAIVRL